MKLSIIIPAYQEEATIGEVLERVAGLDLGPLGFTKEILVCDDGSTDGTAAALAEAERRHGGIRVLRHAHNRGKGAAIRTALDHASGDYVLIQDADLEYEVSDYPAMLAAVQAGADVVYGSRFLRTRYPSGMQLQNYAANRLLTVASNLLYGHRITDEATCFKVIRTDLLRGLNLTCQRFEFCPEVTAKLGLRHVTIAEVPVSYQARGVWAGKKVRWTDGWHALWVLLSHRVRRR